MRFQVLLAELPPRNGGLHGKLPALCCEGLRAGMSQDQIMASIRNKGSDWADTKILPNREINSALLWASGQVAIDPSGGNWISSDKPKRIRETNPDKLAITAKLIEQGRDNGWEYFQDRSTVSIPSDPIEQAQAILEHLYRPDDILFIGSDGRFKPVVKTVAEHLERIHGDLELRGMTHIVPNTFTGNPAPTADGAGESVRADLAVKDFRFAVVEHDGMSLDDQFAFWSVAPLPVAALIFSGSKSLHAWIRITGVNTYDEWEQQIRRGLFDQFLSPMGFDPATSNCGRLSRLAGAQGKDRHIQQLLYLNPEAGV